ncbi:ATP-dependent DNA helicase UvrD2 [Microbacterium sp. ARD31]|uniref:ATP-dependent DNA helicase UvrD2 n=1 Tax=Microbacterium sp. ARD31 TaxID=2962576 RepID=UPI00288105AD|nr:ATP-dependent DNA helicase UvrD2 [Microbacterium sp. ARD31]MDT0188499.1 ATP-dependent DNA helicase UvrD2 [Microbacterium sp. ARD31]
MLEALDPEQRQVAEALRGPVRVLAGAGTGKTRAITHRIAHGVATGLYAPTEVLALSFTTRAAGEMRERLRSLGAPGVQARTFHSAALRQLRFFWPRVHNRELPELTESKLSMLALAARRQRLGVDQATLRDLASEIEWAKVSNVAPDAYPAVAASRGRAVSGLEPAVVARAFDSYEEVKRSQGRMDMEDVLLFAAGLLADNEAVAAQVRRQYKWFVVDEFQDVSPLQHALLDLWLGGRDELCVVGDPAQTIYSFAGADAHYLRDFTQRFPGATSVELVRNYRSTPEVVAGANTLLAGTASKGVDLVAQRASGPAISFREAPDEVAEADAVAERVAELRASGTPASRMAVLLRINAQSERFEEALAARGIPYVIRGAARFFDRGEVRQAITLVRGAARSGDASGPVPDAVLAVLSQMGHSTQPPEGRGEVRNRWESLQALVDLAVDFGRERPDADLGAFVDDLDRRAGEQHAPVADAVTVATIHSAKGLEWDAVFVAGMHEKMMPIAQAQTPAEVEEERRLLYVAMTRARDELAVSWATAREPGGRSTRGSSPFLAPLLDGVPGVSAQRRERSRRNRAAMHCRECGRALSTAREKKTGRCADCPASYDEAMFERLREWRLARASADGVPAFVVFTDATLQLIAEHVPRDDRGLRAISGVGPSKLTKYGDEVLAVVAGTAVPEALGDGSEKNFG